MYRVTYITSWQGLGTDADPYRPEDIDCQSCVDITGQPVPNLPTAPNVFVVELVVTADQLVLLDQDRILTEEEIGK